MGLTTRSVVRFLYFFMVVPYLRSTTHRPKPLSRLLLFITMASSISYPAPTTCLSEARHKQQLAEGMCKSCAARDRLGLVLIKWQD